MARPLLLGAFLLIGCNPTYAPPVRSTHLGAPAHADRDESELRAGAGVGGEAPLLSGGLMLPVGGSAHLELRGEGSDAWVLGTAGLRLDALREQDGEHVTWLADVGFGAGVGRGGELCGNQEAGDENCDGEGAVADGRAWHERLAGGGYLDAGLGLAIDGWLVPFARAALRMSAATGIPLTTWASAMLGVDFRFDRFSIALGGGWAGYANEHDANHGPFLESSLAFRFGGG